MSFYCDVVEKMSMFVWGVLKHGVLNSVQFCIGDLPMYIFFISTHPYLKVSKMPTETQFIDFLATLKLHSCQTM